MFVSAEDWSIAVQVHLLPLGTGQPFQCDATDLPSLVRCPILPHRSFLQGTLYFSWRKSLGAAHWLAQWDRWKTRWKDDTLASLS